MIIFVSRGMGSIEEKIGFESIPLSASESMNKLEVEVEVEVQVQPLNCESLQFPREVHGVSILRSIYIVLLKPKINVLLPFGPLAILLHHFTSKQVNFLINTP